MNETLPPPPAVTSPTAKPARGPRWRVLLLVLVVAAGALLVWQQQVLRGELERTRAEFARRLSDNQTQAGEAQAIAKQVREGMDGLQQHIGALDARLADAASQQDALESMYQEMLRARDERFLTEVEQAVGIASQQLLLGGNVPAALAALHSAEARLASQSRPQLLAVRKLVLRDIERLRALPLADFAGMALRLETMLGVLDTLPLGFEHKPQEKKVETKKLSKPAAGAADKKSAPPPTQDVSAPVAQEPGFFSGLLNELWAEVRQLIRIERLDRPDPALLSPQQAAYLRENLRLRLLSARLGLLQRDARSFAEDTRQARLWLERYFDIDAPAVANMLSELRQMEAARLNVELPSLAETEAALRNLKFGRGN